MKKRKNISFVQNSQKLKLLKFCILHISEGEISKHSILPLSHFIEFVKITDNCQAVF